MSRKASAWTVLGQTGVNCPACKHINACEAEARNADGSWDIQCWFCLTDIRATLLGPDGEKS